MGDAIKPALCIGGTCKERESRGRTQRGDKWGGGEVQRANKYSVYDQSERRAESRSVCVCEARDMCGNIQKRVSSGRGKNSREKVSEKGKVGCNEQKEASVPDDLPHTPTQ